jgi:hypothetical protein
MLLVNAASEGRIVTLIFLPLEKSCIPRPAVSVGGHRKQRSACAALVAAELTGVSSIPRTVWVEVGGTPKVAIKTIREIKTNEKLNLAGCMCKDESWLLAFMIVLLMVGQ